MSINYYIILRMLGLISLITGISMIPSIFVSFFRDSLIVFHSFLWVSISTIIISSIIIFLTRSKVYPLKVREGYLSVTVSCLSASIIGALPYYFSGATNTLIDAIFESIAAFTTTGASVVGTIHLPMGIILWKAITHWLGGMGILVFAVSILPALGVSGGLKLASAEAPGPNFNKVKTKITDSSKTLYLIYIGLTIIKFILFLSFS